MSTDIYIQLHMVGSEKHTYNAIKCEKAVQGHPRSLISIPIKSAYATSYYLAHFWPRRHECQKSPLFQPPLIQCPGSG